MTFDELLGKLQLLGCASEPEGGEFSAGHIGDIAGGSPSRCAYSCVPDDGCSV